MASRHIGRLNGPPEPGNGVATIRRSALRLFVLLALVAPVVLVVLVALPFQFIATTRLALCPSGDPEDSRADLDREGPDRSLKGLSARVRASSFPE